MTQHTRPPLLVGCVVVGDRRDGRRYFHTTPHHIMTTTEENRAQSQAEAQLDSIRRLVSELDEENGEDTRRRIHEHPLNVQVRTNRFHDPQVEGIDPDEYMILLCTGGPAVRIVGELNEYNEPVSAEIQFQDWFEEWADLGISGADEETVIRYALQFWYGER